MTCPQCGEACTRDLVDVGVGEMPSGPYGCENCGWLEPLPPDVTIVHYLNAGRALCGLAGPPNQWPDGHRWVSGRGATDEVTCQECRRRLV